LAHEAVNLDRPTFRLAHALVWIGVVVACFLHTTYWVPNHDVSLILVEAQKLSAGGDLHRDVMETNPPLVIYLSMPGLWFSPLVQGSAWAGLMVWFGLLTRWALTSSLGVARKLWPEVPDVWLAGVLVWALVVLPGYDLFQREHLAACLFLPALFRLVAQEARPADPPEPWMERTFCWLMASLGLLLKPFFLVLPALCLVVLALRTRSWKPLWGLEARVLLATTLGYLALITGWARGWLDTMELTVHLYHGYNAPWWAVLQAFQLNLLFVLVPMLVVALPALAGRRPPHLALLGMAWLWAVLAFLQSKGWHYHMLPSCMFAALSLGVAAAQVGALARPLPAALSLALALALGQRGLVTSLSPDYLRTTALSSEFAQAVQRHGRGRAWVAWSTSVTPAFPLAAMIPGEWASRMACQWLVPGATTLVEQRRGSPAQAEQYRWLAAQINAEDLDRYQPAVVMVETGHALFLRRPLDLLAYFSVHPSFQRAWSRYRFQEQVGVWAVYVRTPPDPAGQGN
jgi:hypothetical protein